MLGRYRTGLALLLVLPVSLPVTAATGRAASYGEAQLEVILQDRPQLAAVLMGRGEVRDWLVRELGRDAPKPLWDPTEPVSGRAAEHEYPSRGGTTPAGTALIRVSSQTSGWDQLAGLVFELHNLRGSGAFEEIQQAAVRGDIDKPAYVQQLLQQEFTALLATRDFLEEHLSGAPEAARDQGTLFGQILHTEATLEAHLRKNDQDGNDLTRHFEQLYEQEVMPERRRADETDSS